MAVTRHSNGRRSISIHDWWAPVLCKCFQRHRSAKFSLSCAYALLHYTNTFSNMTIMITTQPSSTFP